MKAWAESLCGCAAGLLHLLTSGRVVGRLPNGHGAGRGDAGRHHSRAAGLPHLLTSGRPVGRLPHGKRAGHADAGRHRRRAAGLPDGPGPGRFHNQPNHLGAGGVPLGRRPGHGNGLKRRRRPAQLLHHRTSGRFGQQARRHGGSLSPANSRALSGQRRGRPGGGEILGPTDVSLSNWTVRPSSGCSVVLATHTAGAASVDGYTLTLAVNPWNIVRTYNLTPGPELLFACRYRLGTASNFVVYMSEANNVYDPLYGSFVGDQGAWSTAKMYFFTVPPNGVAKLHFGAHFQAPGLPNQTAGTVPPDPGCNSGGRQHDGGRGRRDGLLKHEFGGAGAHAHHARQFSGALQQPELRGLGQLHGGRLPAGGLRHDPERLRLEHRVHLHPDGGDYSFACRRRLGTASNLVMYVSAADNDYVGVSTARLDFSVPGRSRKAALRSLRRLDPRAGSSRRARWTCTACRSGPRPSRESRSRDGPAGRLAGPHAALAQRALAIEAPPGPSQGAMPSVMTAVMHS